MISAEESGKIASIIRDALITSARPDHAMAQLGGFLANVIGPIPEEKWQQMIRESEKGCDDKECHCGAIAGAMMNALDDLRTDWIGNHP